jgi:hydrogenase maturation protein HypF
MTTGETEICRLKLVLHGAVQGVGFRPFIHRLATELNLPGWVSNSTHGLDIEVEGPHAILDEFWRRLPQEKPAISVIQSLEGRWLDAVGYQGFVIRPSDDSDRKTAFIMPDLATCPECLREIFDPANRRYRYAFTNCTNCGPRYSIIQALPYDRANTTMRRFVQCADCEAEYHDPANRRFHAQPNACPVCGPQLSFSPGSVSGVVNPRSPTGSKGDALLQAAEEIRAGKIVAVKGLGGFHLLVDARKPDAIARLRVRKHREEKPFALMFPSLEWLARCCLASEEEIRLLRSPQAPIVLLPRRTDAAAYSLPQELAPGNPYLGVMLPYTPLHHLLLRELDFPVVATSGNLSDEPICIEEQEARTRLKEIADFFLTHNRPIERHVDDSIARVVLGREMILRRARGYAPLPISLPPELSQGPDVLGVGGQLKSSVALGMGDQVWISQHIGDLETLLANQAFESVIADLQRLYAARLGEVGADLHPNYLSTRYARRLTDAHGGTSAPSLTLVQHHVAHVLACMAENGVRPPVLGVAWDGTGYGTDGTIWGGEFFLIEAHQWRRIAHLRRFRLPGGDQAVREPRRAALGLLYELRGESVLADPLLPVLARLPILERKNLLAMLKGNLNAPLTSSAGRLFDAVAAILDLREVSHFEGQAAMELEFAAEKMGTGWNPSLPGAEAAGGGVVPYSVEIMGRGWNPSLPGGGEPLVIDWGPMITEILEDLQHGRPVADLSARFHATLAQMIVAVAKRAGVKKVALSGGCFQNARLLACCVQGLHVAGFSAYWHQRVPPNDGGIALGQVVGAREKFA